MLNAIIDEKIDALHLLAALPFPPNRLSSTQKILFCVTRCTLETYCTQNDCHPKSFDWSTCFDGLAHTSCVTASHAAIKSLFRDFTLSDCRRSIYLLE